MSSIYHNLKAFVLEEDTDRPNIYYNPKDFGLEVVAEIDYSDGCYQFDKRVVWKEIDGRKFFTMRDSGCSYPVPFEDYNRSNIDLLDFEALRREVYGELAELDTDISPETAQKFLSEVKAAAYADR